MNEKRFRVRFEQEDGKGEIVNEKGVELTAREVVDLLNEQQATINKLKERNAYNFAQNIQLKKEIKELKEEEKLYAKEIVRLNKNIEELNKTIEEALKFKSLGGDY